ncbi:MAG: riboflavin synthase [Burkholderiaceae bacterium]|jgi:riboflavin synthase|nr:riboflavin synthase [Burkholderiaceae bacterium]
MFTGIVQAIGEITAVVPAQVAWGGDGIGLRITVSCGQLDVSDVRIGDSIAINGACMTVVHMSGDSFQADVSRESLNRTAGLDHPGPVNLEKAMRASDRLGGHWVSGHVDGTGRVRAVTPQGESHTLVVTLPTSMAAYVSEKGSIACDGVSLTVNRVLDHSDGCDVSINLIPHTWQATVLHLRRPGDAVNIEVDQLAKQVERILARIHQTP